MKLKPNSLTYKAVHSLVNGNSPRMDFDVWGEGLAKLFRPGSINTYYSWDFEENKLVISEIGHSEFIILQAKCRIETYLQEDDNLHSWDKLPLNLQTYLSDRLKGDHIALVDIPKLLDFYHEITR